MKRQNMYHNYKFHPVSGAEKKELEKHQTTTDQVNWRVFFKRNTTNLIGFYPFSEYHGGGQMYVVNIKSEEFDNWLENNPEFEKDIRRLIDQKSEYK